MRPIKTAVIERNELLREGLKRILAETRFQPLRMCCSFDELDAFPTYSRDHLFILCALDLLKASKQQTRCGASNKVIGRKLGITESTVNVHLKAIMRKIRMKNRTQAAIWAAIRQPPPNSAEWKDLGAATGKANGHGSSDGVPASLKLPGRNRCSDAPRSGGLSSSYQHHLENPGEVPLEVIET
jgi:hypothetical protein